MSNFLLLHGGAFNGWFWYKVKHILEQNDDFVLAPDLPGHASNYSGDYRDITFDRYVDFVSDCIVKTGKQCILVGHSFGGAVITKVHNFLGNEYIRKLVYVCAIVPKNGESVGQILKNDTTTLSQAIRIDTGHSCIEMLPGTAENILFNECDEEDVRIVTKRIVPQPLFPVMAPVALHENHDVERIGIVCTNDRALSPGLQERMYVDHRCEIFYLSAGHAPFISHADELCAILDR